MSGGAGGKIDDTLNEIATDILSKVNTNAGHFFWIASVYVYGIYQEYWNYVLVFTYVFRTFLKNNIFSTPLLTAHSNSVDRLENSQCPIGRGGLFQIKITQYRFYCSLYPGA